MNANAVTGDILTVFLVHGTNARGAPWSRPGSPIASALTAAFPHVQIISFDWSGENSHEARILAGRYLASRIRRVAEEEPQSRIVIIGHSHGGSVALYALREKSAATRVSDVIFLGTPFFRFVRMDVRPAVRFFARIVGFLTFIAAFSLVVAASSLVVIGAVWSGAAAWLDASISTNPIAEPVILCLESDS